MDRRRRPDPGGGAAPPSPPATSSPPLLDLSNYKTPRPRPCPQNPVPSVICSSPLFFTASKITPSSTSAAPSAFRRRAAAGVPASLSKAARRLKALELEQSRTARKVQIRREKALRSLSRSLTAWLNFLFQNPKACGCGLGAWSEDRRGSIGSCGKRDSLDGGGEIWLDGKWRSPKRRRDCLWKGPSADHGVVREPSRVTASAMFSSLKASLQEVCSFEDMKERMEAYMSRKGCMEVLMMMNQVCKNIDEGRLKMKSHCPIVTDLGLKEKAAKVLMSYNPIWLRIGLHIVFGGDSLLLNEEGKVDPEDLFLKMIIEKQFFSHSGIAKSYAYNKLVEGLYRPGYFEALGDIILKRFLLLVISLDKAKSESTLVLKYGIDSVDGGSPMLFCRHSHIKSSQQVVHEFLSEVMHGEGNLLAHLVILGCKLNYQQPPLSEYDFTIRSLFEDLQDGILLCRAIQLLQHDASILSKVMAPSDTHKKNLQNCNVAMLYLKKAGVTLSDGDGIQIEAEDVANADKELTISILWNMFLQLQVPLLIDRTALVEEIMEMKASDKEHSKHKTDTIMGLLLEWIQVVCERYHIRVENFSSLMDGEAICCLIDYYLSTDICGHYSSKESHECNENLVRRSDVAVRNFISIQSVTSMLGNFPEVLVVSDVLDGDASFDERTLTILLVFLASELIQRKKSGQLKTYSSKRSVSRSPDVKPSAVSSLPFSGNDLLRNSKSRGKSAQKFTSPLKNEVPDRYGTEDWSARIIQSHLRRYIQRIKFLKIKMATSLLQNAIRAWLAVALGTKSSTVNTASSVVNQSSGIYDRYLTYMIERRKFLHVKKSVIHIQQAVRAWITRRHQMENTATTDIMKPSDNATAAPVLQSYVRGQLVRCRYFCLLAHLQKQRAICGEWEALSIQTEAAIKIQVAWKRYIMHKFLLNRRCAAVKIQCHWRSWYTRMNFLSRIREIKMIQAGIRCLLCQKEFRRCRLAAIVIQRFTRGHLARNRLLGASYLRSGKLRHGFYNMSNNGAVENLELKIVIHSVLQLQRWWRQVLLHKSQTVSAIFIQSFIRGLCVRISISKLRHSVYMIQRWWRNILFLQSRKKSVLLIQAYVRGWIARRAISRDKSCILVIQSYWKGYLVRKHSGRQLTELRHRIQNSAANVDDNMRLINRLVAALSVLLECRSISSIRHTCATLNVVTEHSQRCCETLVAAGAVDILLKQIHFLNRGVPDQEVLKHVLSSLRNIVRFPQLIQVLVNTPQSVEIIFQELLRNKSEVFFIACELLQKLCSTQEGLQAVRRLQGHVRRLTTLAQELERKNELQKRNARLGSERDVTMRRLREAVNLLQLIVERGGQNSCN